MRALPFAPAAPSDDRCGFNWTEHGFDCGLPSGAGGDSPRAAFAALGAGESAFVADVDCVEFAGRGDCGLTDLVDDVVVGSGGDSGSGLYSGGGDGPGASAAGSDS